MCMMCSGDGGACAIEFFECFAVGMAMMSAVWRQRGTSLGMSVA